jgi:hypothetical protein
MSAPTLTDPVLGTLSYRRDWYEWSQWDGRVEFQPGLWIDLVFNEWRYGDVGRLEQMAKCREIYLGLVGREEELRTDTVIDLKLDGLWPGVDAEAEPEEAEWEAMTAQLQLVRIELHSDGGAGLYYRGPQAVTGGQEIKSFTQHGEFNGALVSDEVAAPEETRSALEAVKATELFRAVAARYPGAEVWPDPMPQGDGCEYCWIMSVEGTQATNLAYFRLQGHSLQIKIKNRDGETRWLDVTGWSTEDLLRHVRPRWRLS